MFIQTERTPNPETLKFLPGRTVTGGRGAEFRAPADAARAPLAQALFAVEGVQGVFLGADFVSVTKAQAEDWDMLKPRVMAALMEHFSLGRPVITEDGTPSSAEGGEEDSEIVLQIKEILETRVQPTVAADGGHIEFVRFEDGVVWLHMQGACAGCPSSTITLKSGIENLLKHFVPEVESVEAVPGPEY